MELNKNKDAEENLLEADALWNNHDVLNKLRCLGIHIEDI